MKAPEGSVWKAAAFAGLGWFVIQFALGMLRDQPMVQALIVASIGGVIVTAILGPFWSWRRRRSARPGSTRSTL